MRIRAAAMAATIVCGITGWMTLADDGAPVVTPATPFSLGVIAHPEDNPSTEAKIALGKQLYFDPRLSSDMTVSCASCHDPKKGWGNGESVATGFGGAKGGRNSPTVLNSAFNKFQFWDGRAKSLEEQALGPIQNPIEMSMKLEDVVDRLNKIEGYRTQFQEVFGTDVTSENLAKAIAAFERTIITGETPFDRYKAGDETALSESAARGRALFFGKANCSACHSGPLFTDHAFHNVGVGVKVEKFDVGRAEISKLVGDTGGFKTPSLREVGRTGPYMHDGSFATLEEVVAHYNKGAEPHDQLDEEIFPLKLTEQQQADLVTFLREGLSSETYPDFDPPQLPE